MLSMMTTDIHVKLMVAVALVKEMAKYLPQNNVQLVAEMEKLQNITIVTMDMPIHIIGVLMETIWE